MGREARNDAFVTMTRRRTWKRRREGGGEGGERVRVKRRRGGGEQEFIKVTRSKIAVERR